ncbi:Uncharacterized protein C20orf112-like protein [Harpegnathos saltator]|uniref:Uncharacterized protein C20orf112-like protein n=1 Tax=Harpegnathos saltator TaxID=610380 RepID=E2BT24_HARSA|nr:Uncharacterized protein C20orf112-like protein [Harpegnathos saltator]
MLLAWNYNLQQQAHAQVQAANAALSPNNSATTTATTVGTPVTSQSAISTANNTINNATLTDSRNGSAELVDMPAGTVPNLSAVAGTEDMASLWYAMGFKKTPPPASSATPSRSDRDRESSPPGGEGAGSAHDETSSSGNKEDEDDDDEDADERLDPRHHDPERLKAFNMFVRLFVDENLDRIVPISKQPKEKIQAIIDSCTRQFPEFAERARKRIRTYLKSCRRNKRGREGAPWDTARPTPAHLTSAQAEQILAFACENESENAKRMRLGLEPVSQPMPTLPAATVSKKKESSNHKRIRQARLHSRQIPRTQTERSATHQTRPENQQHQYNNYTQHWYNNYTQYQYEQSHRSNYAPQTTSDGTVYNQQSNYALQQFERFVRSVSAPRALHMYKHMKISVSLSNPKYKRRGDVTRRYIPTLWKVL